MILLQTLGAVDLRREGTQARSVLSQPKRLALLAYLAAATPRGPHSRERLLALFWPESDDDRARNSLRQALHYLRRSLGDDAIVSRSDREVGIDPGIVRCDAVAFEDAVAAGRPAEALDLYQGEFLAGLYVDAAPEIEHWIDEQRTRYRRAAVEAAHAAAEAEERRGGTSSATLIMRRALGIAPHDEAALRYVLELHERTGARAAAVQDYEAFARRFELDLGLEPSPETRALIERIRDPRTQTTTPPTTPAASTHAPGPTVASASAPPPPAPFRGDDASAAGAVTAPAAARVPPAPRPRRTPAAALAAATLLIVLATAAGVVAGRAGWLLRSASAASPGAIAVLPFANMSGDPAHEFLSDGMAEELMTALARVPGLLVVARTSAFSFKGQAVSVDSIARALKVAHVLEGSVRLTGDRLRITAQLVDAGSGYQVWGGTFDGELADAFAVQDSIARAIVEALEPSLATAPRRSTPRPTDDADAHADFLRGLGALGRDSPDGFARGAEFFRRALERDPSYAEAWAGLARVRLVEAYRRVVPPDEGYAEAKALAERALGLDPSIPSAHVALGRIAEDHAWDFAAAEQHYRRALDLAPGDVNAMRALARLLVHLGRAEEALRLSQRALELDPVSPLAHRWVGTTFMLAGRHEQAVPALQAALALTQENGIASNSLALSLTALGRHEEAVTAAEHALARSDEQMFVAHAATANAEAGRIGRARELMAVLESSPRPAWYYLAMIHAALGETDRAFEMLDRALVERESLMPQLGSVPAFDRLRADPRFDEVLKRVGLPTPPHR